MDSGGIILAASALVLSIISFIFSIKSWRESNRPIVTARVTTFDSWDSGAALKIVVENTGNRPAKNVRLTVEPEVLEAALLSEPEDGGYRKHVECCFSDRGVIPVLGNGKLVSNNFGLLSDTNEKSTWGKEHRFNIEIYYEDLDGRKYKHTNPLLIAEDQGFAGATWVLHGKAK